MDGLDPYSIGIISVFIVGYFLITIEHLIHIDKATIALLMGITCWTIQFCNPNQTHEISMIFFGNHLSQISQIIFFLMGSLAIVAIMNAHNGFSLISNALKIHSKKKLLWVIGILSFFLSAVLDNLTTTIVMIALLSRLLERNTDRLIIGGGVVIAANAGGAWTPIGDVTTTMLWIGGQISTWATMHDLLLPSLATLAASLAVLSLFLKGSFDSPKFEDIEDRLEPLGGTIFFLGTASLIFVPIFKILTGLPPFMGTLFGLSILWFVTDFFHNGHTDRIHLRVPRILTTIDFSGLLFFLGILLAIDALDSAGILEKLAHGVDHYFSNTTLIAIVIGLASAVVDNIPLVAATMGMYSLEQFPTDHTFWQKIAFCAGTGGSVLIIGSAAGVVYMGLEKVDFFWFLKKISLAALIGYFAGIGVYLLF